VNLYSQYKGRVQFVVIDLDHKLSPAQQELAKKYFAGSIPHVVVLDRSGNAVYNSAGEVEESAIAAILDKELK
jgi:thioredoxin-related protein